LRELHALFQRYNKKLAVGLNSENMEWPQRWFAGTSDILPQGRIKMDWRTWVSEGLVDELHVWGSTNQENAIQDLLAATKGKPIKITVSRPDFPESQKYLYAKGVRRVTFPTPVTVSTPDNEEEAGYPEIHPVSDLDSTDPDAVLSVLTRTRERKRAGEVILDVPESKLAALLSHLNPMVRRQAANTMGELKVGIAALEQAAVNEPEPSVKAMVFDALGKVNGSDTVAAMAQGFAKVNTWPVRMALRDALSKMGMERFDDIMKAYDTKDSYFRIVLMQSLSRGGPSGNKFGPLLRRAASQDPEEQARWWAVNALASARYLGEDTLEVLYQALDDSSHTVQNRAASSLGKPLASGRVSETLKQRCFDKLLARYQEFGAGCQRTDAEWGWRPIGETLWNAFGDKGKNALLDILNGKNIELAQLTWRVFFQPSETAWHPIAKEDVERRYRFYPGGADHGKCALVDIEAAQQKKP